MGETKAPYLSLVRSSSASASTVGERDGAAEKLSETASAVASAIMQAAVGWVSLCREEASRSVQITPLVGQLYEVDVELVSGDHVLLSVHFEVAPGLEVRTAVAPLRPVAEAHRTACTPPSHEEG